MSKSYKDMNDDVFDLIHNDLNAIDDMLMDSNTEIDEIQEKVRELMGKLY